MHRLLLAAASILALAACEADEIPRDANIVDNTVPPGNVLEPPTGNGSTVTPTENGLTIEVPVGNGTAPGGNTAAPGGNAIQPPGNTQ